MKKRHALHMSWMTLGFALDLGLLLFIELDRAAIKAALGPMDVWLGIHILIALVLIVLYPMTLWSGAKVTAGMPVAKHKRLAMVFLVLRFLLAVTAFLAVQL
ncbi:hypothetical protein OAU50_03920 [Planctomycetota bacterium]|nr:hypothetical protein [Planctomycetota bacterium]